MNEIKPLHRNQWIAKVAAAIESMGEVLVYIRYLYNTPPMQFALISTKSDLESLISVVPSGARLSACTMPMLPWRGLLTESYLRELEDCMPSNGTEYYCVFMLNQRFDVRLDGIGCTSKKALIAELNDYLQNGEYRDCAIAVGEFGPISTLVYVKDSINGPR